jgi:hypothetical protein
MKQCSFSHNVTIQHQFQQTLIFANVYNWNIVESGVKHLKTQILGLLLLLFFKLKFYFHSLFYTTEIEWYIFLCKYYCFYECQYERIQYFILICVVLRCSIILTLAKIKVCWNWCWIVTLWLKLHCFITATVFD